MTEKINKNMGLIFDYAINDLGGEEDDELTGGANSQERVAQIHKRLWQDLRERLDAQRVAKDLDGLKIIKSYADVLSIITKTERLIWGIEEKAPGQEVYSEDELYEAMAQSVFSPRAGKAMDGG